MHLSLPRWPNVAQATPVFQIAPTLGRRKLLAEIPRYQLLSHHGQRRELYARLFNGMLRVVVLIRSGKADTWRATEVRQADLPAEFAGRRINTSATSALSALSSSWTEDLTWDQVCEIMGWTPQRPPEMTRTWSLAWERHLRYAWLEPVQGADPEHRPEQPCAVAKNQPNEAAFRFFWEGQSWRVEGEIPLNVAYALGLDPAAEFMRPYPGEEARASAKGQPGNYWHRFWVGGSSLALRVFVDELRAYGLMA